MIDLYDTSDIELNKYNITYADIGNILPMYQKSLIRSNLKGHELLLFEKQCQ